ncbi:MAG: hypothetical protein FJ224_01590 [Lentisphaerae bacterium]|nr:hypothetical protein [Lentisphaerota bacterium]
MRFRCPYCRHDLGEEPAAVCPNCRKGMVVPAQLSKGYSDRRKRAAEKRRIRREAEMHRDGQRVPAGLASVNNPRWLAAAVMALLLVGGGLVFRSRVATGSHEDYRLSKAAKEVDNLFIALHRFRADCGRFPSAREGLLALVRDPGVDGWRGPYVTLVKPDPWRRGYIYTNDGGVPVRSGGPDRRAGTADDVVPSVSAREEAAESGEDVPAEPGPQH